MNSHPDLPLSEATFFILLSLSAGPRHGYAILKAVQELSDSRILLSTGTLYGAIKRLLDMNWIARLDGEPEDGVDGRGKKVYQLTGLGRRILQAEVERFEDLVRKAHLQRVEDGI